VRCLTGTVTPNIERSAHLDAPGLTVLDSAVHDLGEMYQAGDLCIDVGRHRVAREGVEIPLPNLSFELLLALAKAHPRMLTTDELLESIWAPAVVNPETVGQRVKLLRQALGDDPRAPRYVVGVRGLGYRMDVPVARAEREPRAPAHTAQPSLGGRAGEVPETGSGPGARRPPAGMAETPAARRFFRRSLTSPSFWALAVAALVAVGTISYLTLRVSRLDHRSSPQVARQLATGNSGTLIAPRAKPRLAILPFENLSPDPADAFFTDGMHEEILATLSSLAPGLEVISRTTMMTYRQTPKPLEAIARELGATHVLEGSVRREGKHVRLTVQLIDARTDNHLWAQRFDRTLVSALRLQADVANQIATQLSVQLAPETARSKLLTSDPQAYDLYLKEQLLAGSSVLVGAGASYDDLRRIESLLDEALKHDPQFAAAYARRSQYRSLEWYFNYDIEGRSLRLAQEDLKAAERLAPTDPVVLFTRGHWLYALGDLNGALKEFEQANLAGLVDPLSVGLTSEVLGFSGRMDEAIERARRAMTLDPKNRFVLSEVVFLLQAARRPEEALRTLNFGMAQFPNDDALRASASRIAWSFTGNERALNDAIDAVHGDALDASVDALTLERILAPMRLGRRFRDMTALLRGPKTNVIRAFWGRGNAPLAEYRGWLDLLLVDRTAAANDGRQVLDFVARRRVTELNRAFLQSLTAEGLMFLGDKTRAVAAARKILQLAQNPMDRFWLTPVSARVYAWAGAEDEATALLEQLSVQIPMRLSPAELARDPLYTVPLGGNARYQALKAKLEAQMASTRLE
jgi:TolB-like protein/DNA-binding winged helix-turn-helix (wHTH) protein